MRTTTNRMMWGTTSVASVASILRYFINKQPVTREHYERELSKLIERKGL